MRDKDLTFFNVFPDELEIITGIAEERPGLKPVLDEIDSFRNTIAELCCECSGTDLDVKTLAALFECYFGVMTIYRNVMFSDVVRQYLKKLYLS